MYPKYKVLGNGDRVLTSIAISQNNSTGADHTWCRVATLPAVMPVSIGFQPWRKALAYEGSSQVGLMRRLFELRPWHKMVPDQSVLASGAGDGVPAWVVGDVRPARCHQPGFLERGSCNGRR